MVLPRVLEFAGAALALVLLAVEGSGIESSGDLMRRVGHNTYVEL